MAENNLILTVSVDDVNPFQQYRILGTPVEKWMQELHDKYSVKFTLFIPSNYHQQWPISEHKGWINELYNDPKFELAAHGHFHQTSNSKMYGEMEFMELKYHSECFDRLKLLTDEWRECLGGKLPSGWRNPGWKCSPESKRCLDGMFDYVAIHYEHNLNYEWLFSKTFFGHDGIQQENIEIHNNDMIMFQSHIAGKHNHNVWNEDNYNQLRISLDYLFSNYNITPKLLKECLD